MPFVVAGIGPAGPTITVFVTITQPHADALQAAGQPLPAPFRATLLVDTGASGTNLCASVIPHAGLTQSGVVNVHTPSTGATPVQMPQYDAQIAIPLHDGSFHVIEAMPIICTDFTAQGIHGLLGRDVLSRCVMHYNGVLGSATLSL